MRPWARTRWHTYRFEPFRVPEEGGPYELAIGYTWAPVELARLEIGLWDPDGTDSPAGFRGWSGSREGRIHEQQAPISISPYGGSRGYVPGEIEAGVWNVEIGAAELPIDGPPVSYRIEITCTPESAYSGPGRTAIVAAPVAGDLLLNADRGWYAVDPHVRGYHSSPNGPSWDQVVQYARAAGLDAIAVAELGTDAHWRELGPVQADAPDLLLWPAREIANVGRAGRDPG